MERLVGFWGVIFVGILFSKWDVQSSELDKHFNGMGTDEALLESMYGMSAAAPPADAPMVSLTLIQGAAAKGAVCLDGTLPGYHLHPGSGAGANSWFIQLEGGGWCNTIRSCVYRKTTRRGSSKYFEKQLPFTGILSNKAGENPDFFNWNRVKIRYCDGASFSGEGENKSAGLQFRGQRIWKAAVDELMSKGMSNADQALLSGCSAGGLASILHCDEFRDLFPSSTKVKCLSDAGFFMDAIDVSGGHALRDFFDGVTKIQSVQANLPATCTSRLDPTSCFFPQNVIAGIRTPLFILNAAYDSWQVQNSLTPASADPGGEWRSCRMDIQRCSASQIQVLQEFRDEMVKAVKGLEESKERGVLINSCYVHCQTEVQQRWFADHSPTIGNKSIAVAVGDWYFDRSEVKLVDCPYPCNKTCQMIS